MISGGLPGPGMGGITGGGISVGTWVPGSGVVARVMGIMVFSIRWESQEGYPLRCRRTANLTSEASKAPASSATRAD